MLVRVVKQILSITTASVFGLLLFLVLSANAKAATYTVTNTSDSGAGSLRQAMLDAEATPGVDDVINFAIPGSGPFTITPLTNLPGISDTVTIDGASQSGTSCGTLVPALPSTSNTPHTLLITINGVNVDNIFEFISSGDASNSIIRGLNLNGANDPGDYAILLNNPIITDIEITCNYIGTDITGTSVVSNETGISSNISTSVITNNLISGNTYGIFTNGLVDSNLIGTTGTGMSALPNTAIGVIPRQAAQVNSNLISGNLNGVESNIGTNQFIITGNIIGLNLAGTAALPNTAHGIFINGKDPFDSFDKIRIGGSTPAERNIISGNGMNGIELYSTSSPSDGCGTAYFDDLDILGNYIGTDTSGSISPGIGNGQNGIMIHALGYSDVFDTCFVTLEDIMIGGPSPSDANTIAGNGTDGIRVYSGPVSEVLGVTILLNSIFENAGLGINLANSTSGAIANADLGVNLNDSGDSDGNANRYLNFPVLNNAIYDSNNQVTINYDLDINPSDPHTSYRVDFYMDNSDPSGHGEAPYFLGSDFVAGNVTGQTTATLSSPVPILDTSNITAVTTIVGIGANGFNGSSEFAANIHPTRINSLSNNINLAPTGQNAWILYAIALLAIISPPAYLGIKKLRN